jgi:replicative DNA helicase
MAQQHARKYAKSAQGIGSPEALPFRAAPHNIEAEQALLGAILVNNEAHDRVSGFLEQHHFYDPLHQQIYETASKLIASGKQATPITLRTFFENAEPIDAGMTAPQYLGRLAANAATIINARDYGRTIHDLATRRSLISICEEAVNTAFDSPVDFPPREQIEEVERGLYALAATGESGQRPSTFDAALEEALRRIDDAHRRGDGLAGISTGIKSIDIMTGGVPEGEMMILASRPSVGKTALGTNIVFNMAAAGIPAAFISIEMSASDVAMRCLAADTGISLERLRRGLLQTDEMARLVAAKASLTKMPLHILDSAGQTAAQIRSTLRRLKRKHGTRAAVIDYLQLMNFASQTRGLNRAQEIGDITKALRNCAKELHMALILLCQLNRETDKREGRRPQMTDLRDSGAIEADADVIGLLHREEYYLERNRPRDGDEDAKAKWDQDMERWAGRAELIIAKVRQGRPGPAWLRFDGPTTTFSSDDSAGVRA